MNADVSGADLLLTSLDAAQLTETNLSGANLGWVSMSRSSQFDGVVLALNTTRCLTAPRASSIHGSTGQANTDRVVEFSEGFPTELTLPPEMSWIVLSSVMLAAGSTIYVVFCPAAVQNYSEVQWV